MYGPVTFYFWWKGTKIFSLSFLHVLGCNAKLHAIHSFLACFAYELI